MTGRTWWDVTKWVLAVGLGPFLPVAGEYWPPTSLILWALIGDPDSKGEAVATLMLGILLLSICVLGVYVLLSLIDTALRRPQSLSRTVSSVTVVAYLVLGLSAHVDWLWAYDTLGVGGYLREHSTYWICVALAALMTWIATPGSLQKHPEGTALAE